VLIDVHSHYMPKALARALERRVGVPWIFKRGDQRFIEYGERSLAPPLLVFFEPELILEQMDQAGIDHAVLSVTIPGVGWLDEQEGEEVAEAANQETAAVAARYPDRFSGLAIRAEDREKVEHENAARVFRIQVPARGAS
jgi:predicted TIM-barrel fold metal-dependent hydrolase